MIFFDSNKYGINMLWYEEEKDGYKIHFGDYAFTFWKKKQRFSTFEVDITPQNMDDLCKKVNSGESLVSVTPDLSLDLTDPEDNYKLEILLKNHLASLSFEGNL